MGTTGKGIRYPDGSLKISQIAAAMQNGLEDVDNLLTFINPFAGTSLPLDADANTMRTTGWSHIRFTNDAANITNFAAKEICNFHVWSTSNGVTYQLQVTTGSFANIWFRSTGSVTNATWTPWTPLIDPTPYAVAPAAHRAALVAAFKDRRGGVIGTAGLPALAIKFDHGLANFKTKVLPLLRKYDFPWLQAINSRQLGSAGNASTWAELQGLLINDGGEMANHGRDHIGATGKGNIDAQILGPLGEFTTNLPAIICEAWDPPGVLSGEFDGYSPMQTIEQHWNTYAGQLAIANHAAVSGYLPGLHRTLPADLPIGLGHATIDEQTPAWVDGVIRGAIADRAGLKLMLHPIYLDTPGYMTTADLEAVFANIAARRDAGELVVLTPGGLLLADPTTRHRNTLITNGRFTDGLNNWANTTGWTINSAGPIPYATTATGTPLTQSFGFSRKEAQLGGVRELIYRVRATTGATVRTAATGTGINAAKDRVLPASPNWVQVRKQMVIPANFTGNLTVAGGRVAGGPVDVTDIRLQSI
ncbi:hypothetical protein [Arthrobacter sp. HLT1-21]